MSATFRSSLLARATTGGVIRILAAVLAAVVVQAVLVASAPPAWADSASAATTLSGTKALGSDSIEYEDGDFSAAATLETSVDWAQAAVVGLDWDPNLVRQGRALDPLVSFGRSESGTLTLTYGLSATVTWEDTTATFGPVEFEATGPCDLTAGGEAYSCHLESERRTVFNSSPGPQCPGELDADCGPNPGHMRVQVAMIADVTVTPDGVQTLRTATLSGDPAVSADLELIEPEVTDPLTVPCSAAVDDELGYELGELSTVPGVDVATGIEARVDMSFPNPVAPGAPPHPWQNVWAGIVPVDALGGSVALSGDGAAFALGEVQPNNVRPTLDVAEEFEGAEGTAIVFAAKATGPCAEGATYVWEFSDGTTAFGQQAPKTFTGSGSYTGQVTVTDTTGLTDSKDFQVTVANLPPEVRVVPEEPTVAWGRDLTLQAQATDPGADDRSSLTYQWNFADGTPVVVGGAVVTHRWSTPGVYDAAVKVCDGDGGCTTEEVAVTVRRRTTSIGYTGATDGVHSGPATLAASVVDEYGQAVNGASIAFELAGTPAGSATTGGSGTASRTTTVTATAGSYDVSAAFAGNTLYAGSDPDTTTFDVSAMNTALAYTGPDSAKPRAEVALSAVLTDDLGRPLAGKPVTFRLGDQTTGPVTTDANGVAATTLRLTQRPGTYTLAVTWPGDHGRHDPAATSTSFAVSR